MWRLAAAVVAATTALAAQSPAVPAPVVAAVHGPAAAVEQFALAEFRIDLRSVGGRVYTPFGPDDGYTHPDGITVDASIRGPDGRTTTVPAFFYTPYDIAAVDDSREALGISGPSEWRVRYTPPRPGRHELTLHVRDRGGAAAAAPVPFDVVASGRRGFIRVSPDDPRFLRYDNGDDFIPIAEGRQWAPQERRRALSYADAFAADAAAGVNLTRIWDQNDSYNLSIEGADPVWAPHWSQFTQALGIAVGEARSGRRAARFSATESPATEGYVQWIAVRPATRYALSGWIRVRELDGEGAILAAGGSSHLEPGRERTPPQRGTADWTEVRHEFTTGPDQRTVAIWAGAARSTGTAWFDDLSVVALDAAGYDVLSDRGFERHFPKADRGNDPEDPAVAATLPHGTAINQWAAAQLDRIVQAAETHGIAVQLCSHGDVYWTWDATVIDSDYATANGFRTGWLDPRHLGYWQRNYRYRIARWGYSPAILAWEVWNEHGPIDATSELPRFYDILGRFVKAQDPARHLFTTSQWSQAYSPAFWAGSPADVVNYHDYITTQLDRHEPALAGDAAAFVYTLADGLVADWPAGVPRRPFIWGEIGTLERWDVDDKRLIAGRGAALTRHPFLWAGAFSPALTSPVDWQAAPKADSTRALRAFLAGERFAPGGWATFASTDLAPRTGQSVATSPREARVMGLVHAAAGRVLAWVQHRGYTWHQVLEERRTPPPIRGWFETPALPAGRYTVEWWNTRTGRVESRTTHAHDGGTLRTSWPSPLATDRAVKIGRIE
ncbi:MAG: hypothetical protein AB7U83_05810 [Vicinamibacterales bacterium]